MLGVFSHISLTSDFCKNLHVYTKILVATYFCKPSKLKCCNHICEFDKNLQNLQKFRLANISNNKAWCKRVNVI